MPLAYIKQTYRYSMNANEDVLAYFKTEERGLLSRKSLLLLIILGLIIAAVDVIIVTQSVITPSIKRTFFNSQPKIALLIIFIHIVLVPIVSLLLSLFISIIPIKRKKYSQKYPSVAVVLMVITQSVLLTLTLLD